MLQNGMHKAFIQRLPLYLNYLEKLDKTIEYISSTTIARDLDFGEVQVRKDLANVSQKGRPRVGYLVNELLENLRDYLGYNQRHLIILIGCGRLGQALLGYDGFLTKGLEIVAGFDKKISNKTKYPCPVYPLEYLGKYVKENKITTGIITVPNSCAQEVANQMVSSGINRIWNFSSTRLKVPSNVLVQNEDIASDLALLIKNIDI